MTLQEKVLSNLKDVPDFPKPGIVFKDIMPLFRDPILTKEIAQTMAKQVEHLRPTIIAGIESRGFLLGSDRILIHDDVLATGGTAEACKLLCEKTHAEVIGYLFLLDIKFLEGAKKIQCTGQSVHTFVTV